MKYSLEIISPQPDKQDVRRHSFYAKDADASRDSVKARPAGFMRRVISYSIDLSIIFVLFLIFIYWGAMGMQLSWDSDFLLASAMGNLFVLSFVFLYTGYFTFFHAYGGQTPAKMILRIIVVDKNGLPPSHFHSLMRSLCLFLSHLFFGFGFLLVMIGPKKRALHDFLTGTHVMLVP